MYYQQLTTKSLLEMRHKLTIMVLPMIVQYYKYRGR